MAHENINILQKKIEDLTVALDEAARFAKELEVRLQQSQEQSWSGKWELDLVNKEVIWSPEMFDILGFDKTKFKPDMKLFNEKLPPVCKDKLSGAIQKCFHTKQDYSFEHTIKQKDDRLMIARTDLKLMLNDHNLPIKLLGFSTDITHIKTAQQELEKLSTIASTTSNAVLMVDSKMEIEWINEGFIRTFGLRMDEVKSISFGSLLIDPSINIANKDYLYRTLFQQHSINAETQMLTKKGNPIWTLINITPLLDYELNPEKYIVVISDITRQKETERMLELQKTEISQQKDQLELAHNRLKETLDELMRTKISRKSIIFSFITLVLLVILTEVFLDPVIDMYSYNNIISIAIKIGIAFLLKPIEGIYERILIKRALKVRKQS